jgi:hypothetical protein
MFPESFQPNIAVIMSAAQSQPVCLQTCLMTVKQAKYKYPRKSIHEISMHTYVTLTYIDTHNTHVHRFSIHTYKASAHTHTHTHTHKINIHRHIQGISTHTHTHKYTHKYTHAYIPMGAGIRFKKRCWIIRPALQLLLEAILCGIHDKRSRPSWATQRRVAETTQYVYWYFIMF